MGLFFGRGGGRHARILMGARIGIVVVFAITVFAFHPHGTALDILTAVRIVLIVALLGTGWALRRKERRASPPPNVD